MVAETRRIAVCLGWLSLWLAGCGSGFQMLHLEESAAQPGPSHHARPGAEPTAAAPAAPPVAPPAAVPPGATPSVKASPVVPETVAQPPIPPTAAPQPAQPPPTVAVVPPPAPTGTSGPGATMIARPTPLAEAAPSTAPSAGVTPSPIDAGPAPPAPPGPPAPPVPAAATAVLPPVSGPNRAAVAPPAPSPVQPGWIAPPLTPPATQPQAERFESPTLALARVRAQWAGAVEPTKAVPAGPHRAWAEPSAMVVGPRTDPPPAAVEPVSPRALSPLTQPERAPAREPTAAPAAPTLAMPGTRPLVPGPSPASTAVPAQATPRLNPVSSLTPGQVGKAPAWPSGPSQPLSAMPHPVSVRILASAEQGPAPLTVELRAEVRGTNAPVAAYQWQAQDRVVSATHFAVVTFEQPGNHTVELTITDAAGNSHRGRLVIRVTGR